MRARWHVRVNGLVLAWALAAAVVAVAHRAVPAAPWLMVHLLLLGSVSTAILIWSAHFAEAVRRRPLRGGPRGQAARLALHTLGALVVVGGLLAGRAGVVAGGAVLVGATALWHALVLVDQGRHAIATRLGFSARYFLAAACAMPVGAALGAVLARPDLAGEPAARAYVAHVVVMMLGWVGLTVAGTMISLWPTMLRVQLAPDAGPAGRHALAVLVGGLAVVLAGAATGARPVAGAGAGLVVLGLLRASVPLVEEARRRVPESFAARSVGAAWLWLVVTAAWWAGRLLTADRWADVQTGIAATLGPLVVGFAAQVLAGALSHLGPTVLGGGPAAVRAARATVERGGDARLVLTNGGILLYLVADVSLVRVGTSMLVLGALVITPVVLLRCVAGARRGRAAPAGAAAPSDAGAAGAGAVPAAGATGAGAALVAPAALLTRPRRSYGPAVAAAGALALVVAGAVAADPASAGIGSSAADDVAATGRVVEVEVEARDMRFVPDAVEVSPGDALVLVVTNVDDAVHDLVLDSGAGSGRLAPGETARVDVGVVGRSLPGWCSVAGHRQMGMTFDVVVAGTADAPDGASSAVPDVDHPGAHAADGTRDGAGEGTGDGTGRSAAADMDLRGEPGPGFEPYDPVLDPAPATTHHEVTLQVTETEREVAPGVTQTLWTFGGSAPGPVLRGRVGDTFEITLVNDGTIGHSIDFHAGASAPDGPMRTIEPGERLTYSFTATRSGIWMYHCSTAPMSLHIANGMVGAVVIDPPDLPPVDREYLLVQSELYLGEQGGVADAARIAAEQPDAVVFNGYPNQYDHAPLTARVGERVRLWVLDAGPNRPSSFHVVGGQFDTAYLEGTWTLGGPDAPPGATGGAQVLPLLPATGGFVELTFPEAGRYPVISHLMVDAERGAHGVVAVAP